LNFGPWTLSRCSTTWATLLALLCIGYFWDRVSLTICASGLWTKISWSQPPE
jgi:hypothetical protein